MIIIIIIKKAVKLTFDTLIKYIYQFKGISQIYLTTVSKASTLDHPFMWNDPCKLCFYVTHLGWHVCTPTNK